MKIFFNIEEEKLYVDKYNVSSFVAFIMMQFLLKQGNEIYLSDKLLMFQILTCYKKNAYCTNILLTKCLYVRIFQPPRNR